MATFSATSIINSSLKILQVVGFGGAGTTQQIADCLLLLQTMIDNANVYPPMWIGVVPTNVSMTVGVGNYALSTRVPKVLAATMTNLGIKMPMRIVNDIIEWTSIEDATQSSKMPRSLFYDRQNTTGNIYISPVPKAGLGTLTIWTPQQQTNFTDATTAVEILPGYMKWLRYGLARAISSTFSFPMPPDAQQELQDALQVIQLLNSGLLIPADEPVPPLPRAVSA